ncbi:MFS transporter [Stenotrophomonas sp. ZAC14A_NAIMI4_1]|uniref:MFS transporter n=1 Tax=Stenotrophomonas sp. ZAC14A_NAIMI4_1 TaxID=2072412 RepID=UPI000D53D5BD|nr:MFS transporter [Stenotrophomonas sp. ZAC14A_NAIMI4_1]AWH46478.1 MFS transporter [Stenotrophomonas sp. ZAC14A_NAIMI4_1]
MKPDQNPGGHDARRWPALAVLLTGTLLPPLDFFIVNVALPAIRSDLQASADVTQLVVSVYAMAYAVTLILGGRLGDIHGRRRAFVGGMLGFGLASAICGLAGSAGTLVAGRLLQGISAAVMAPQSLASIHALFPPAEKGRALGLYGATFGIAAVGGQLLGGWLVSVNVLDLGWRSVFLINLPVIALALPAALLLVRETRAAHARAMDYRGAALLAAGVLALVVPLIEGRERGWPWWSLALMVASPALLTAFWRYQRYLEDSGRSPLVPPSALTLSSGLPRGLLAAVCFYALAAFFLVFAVYQQAGLQHDALAAGLAILPLGVGQLLGPSCGLYLSRWLGARVAALGMGLEALALLSAAGLAAAGKPGGLAAPLLLLGIGQGIALPALVRLNVDRVAPHWAGLAAGMVTAAMQMGAALSVALVGGVFFALAPDGAGAKQVSTAFVVACVMIAIAMAAAALLSAPRPALASNALE